MTIKGKSPSLNPYVNPISQPVLRATHPVGLSNAKIIYSRQIQIAKRLNRIARPTDLIVLKEANANKR